MDRVDSFDGFQLHNDAALDEEVQCTSIAQPMILSVKSSGGQEDLERAADILRDGLDAYVGWRGQCGRSARQVLNAAAFVAAKSSHRARGRCLERLRHRDPAAQDPVAGCRRLHAVLDRSFDKAS